MADDLRDLIAGSADLQAVVNSVNQTLLPAVLTRYNSEFGPRYFGRPPEESVPTEPRLLTTFRTRLGTLLEYGLGVTLDAMLREDYGPALRLAFVVTHQYPDFYLRGDGAEILLRIDFKLLHDESDEYSARFTLLQDEIDPTQDLILYGAWQWRSIVRRVPIVYPHVLEVLVVPAIEIARERDLRLKLTGGRFEDDRPVVPPQFNVDTNFGKINRIVHPSRRDAHDLTTNIRAFLDFTQRHAEAVRRASGETEDTQPTEDETAPQSADESSSSST